MDSFKLQNRINYELEFSELKDLDIFISYNDCNVFLKIFYKNLDIVINGYGYPFYPPEVLINNIPYREYILSNYSILNKENWCPCLPCGIAIILKEISKVMIARKKPMLEIFSRVIKRKYLNYDVPIEEFL